MFDSSVNLDKDKIIEDFEVKTSKRKIIRYSIITFVFLLLIGIIIFIIIIISNSNEVKKKDNEIFCQYITTSDNEEIIIINEEIAKYINFDLIINGEKAKGRYSNIFPKYGIQNITFKFIEPLNSLAYLFSEIDSLIKIDFSKFNSLNIDNITSSFEHCILLEKINFGDNNFGNTLDMSRLFINCYSL